MNIQHPGLNSCFDPRSGDDAREIENALAAVLSGTSDTVGLYE